MYHFQHTPCDEPCASADLQSDALPRDEPAPLSGGRPRLILFIAHQDAARSYRAVAVTEDWLLIGRAQGNDVTLSNPLRLVSRHHAEIRWEDGRFWLVDLGSANGTWLDGHRLDTGRRYLLRPGARFAVGDFQVAFIVSEQGSPCRKPPGDDCAQVGSCAVPPRGTAD